MRYVGLAGMIILAVSLAISAAQYLGSRSFIWAPREVGFIYSSILTLGFIIAAGAGLFGAIKESEEFLIAAGISCIAFATLNKLFTNLLYSWGYLDTIFLLAGVMMIIDRFHVKRVKEARRLEEARLEQKPQDLLAKFNMLQTRRLEPETASMLEQEIVDIHRQLSLDTKRDPQLGKTLRVRLYHNPLVQTIVNRLVTTDLKAIEPTIEVGETPAYHELVGLEGFPAKKVESTLKELADVGILESELYEKLIVCPQCHRSSRVFTRTKCPKCDSYNVSIDRLMQHIDCGSIYKQPEYTVPSGLQCPKCGKAIAEESELKLVGIAYKCEACGSAFGDPNRSFYCRVCLHEFQLKDAELASIYSYVLKPTVRSEAEETLTVLAVADLIKKLGYEVIAPGSLKGKTGVSHEFTMTCCGRDPVVAIDFAVTNNEVDTKTVMPSYAKFMDLPPIRRLIVAMPKLEQQAKDFLRANNIQFVEGKTVEEIVSRIGATLR